MQNVGRKMVRLGKMQEFSLGGDGDEPCISAQRIKNATRRPLAWLRLAVVNYAWS